MKMLSCEGENIINVPLSNFHDQSWEFQIENNNFFIKNQQYKPYKERAALSNLSADSYLRIQKEGETKFFSLPIG